MSDLASILSINAGSSSLKFALHPVQAGVAQAASLLGQIEGLEPGGELSLSWHGEHGLAQQKLAAGADSADPFDIALAALQTLLHSWPTLGALRAVVHRVVHGGELFREAVQVDAAVLEKLRSLQPLAPLHQPHNIAGIDAFMRFFPQLPQIACFDTAFHASLPEVEYRFALPQALSQQGIRRYGFHGLSYQSISQSLQAVSPRAKGRVLMAHLGNGASLCATVEGASCATTMGFSTLDGLMMGSRCGALDPGVILHLLAQGWSAEQLQDTLYKRSGLLGVSGITADMRRLRQSDAPEAQLALRMFAARVVHEAGALVADMGGIDILSFSAGIGEHDVVLRQQVCLALGFLGVQLDQAKNSAADGSQVQALHADGSAVEVWLVPTDEGRVAAQAALELLGAEI